MKCLACDVPLNDLEATHKSAETGNYYDLCTKCLDMSELPRPVKKVGFKEETIVDTDDDPIEVDPSC